MTMSRISVQRSGIAQLHQAATVAFMLAVMGVIVGITTPGLADTDLGVVGTAVHLPVVLTTAFLYVLVLSPLLMQPQAMLRGYRSLAWFAPMVLYCLLSASWSSSPSLSFRRSLFLALTTLTGLVLGTKYDLRQIARMVATASVIHLVLVAILIVVDPRMVTGYSDGHAIKGLTSHKNIFGFEAGLALLVFALVPFRRLTLLRWPLVLLAAAMLILSRSAGSLAATVAGLASLPLLRAGYRAQPCDCFVDGGRVLPADLQHWHRSSAAAEGLDPDRTNGIVGPGVECHLAAAVLWLRL